MVKACFGLLIVYISGYHDAFIRNKQEIWIKDEHC